MKKALAAVAVAVATGALAIGAVEASISDQEVWTVLIKDTKGDYIYKERVATKVGGNAEGVLFQGEQLVEVVKREACAGGKEAQCVSGAEKPAISPCVRATGPDCFRKSPADKNPRFFGLKNVFFASEATGAQCEPAPCTIVFGDSPK